jgi:hypothetical protein
VRQEEVTVPIKSEILERDARARAELPALVAKMASALTADQLDALRYLLAKRVGDVVAAMRHVTSPAPPPLWVPVYPSPRPTSTISISPSRDEGDLRSELLGIDNDKLKARDKNEVRKWLRLRHYVFEPMGLIEAAEALKSHRHQKGPVVAAAREFLREIGEAV